MFLMAKFECLVLALVLVQIAVTSNHKLHIAMLRRANSGRDRDAETSGWQNVTARSCTWFTATNLLMCHDTQRVLAAPSCYTERAELPLNDWIPACEGQSVGNTAAAGSMASMAGRVCVERATYANNAPSVNNYNHYNTLRSTSSNLAGRRISLPGVLD